MESKWAAKGANGEGCSLEGDSQHTHTHPAPRSRLPFFFCLCRDCRESGFCKGLLWAGRLFCLQSERARFQCGALGASVKGITAEK